jgi:hypothetical protein
VKEKKRKLERHMLLGICKIRLYLSNSHSLKDKRNILRSIKARIRNNYNISISEIDNYNLWKNTTLGIACIGNDKKYLNKILNAVIRFIKKEDESQLIDYEITII